MENNVILEIGEGEEAKFIYGLTEDQNQEVVCAFPLKQFGFHREINQKLKSEGTSLENVSGGMVKNEGDRIVLYGSSESYGQAPMEHVRELLESNLGKEVIYKSDRDIEEEKRVGRFQNVLGSLETELERESYRAVHDLGIRAGHDYMHRPVTIGDCSLIVFSTENGSSFGFDTLWLNYNSSEGLVTKPLSHERGYINVDSIRAQKEGEELNVFYSSSDGKRNMQIPLGKLENLEPISYLSPTDEKLKGMYEENQDIYKNSEVIHVN